MDGVVVEGASAVNQSLVTGEPIPEDKTVGDEVIGGSLNQTGTLVVQVTRVGEESFLQQVARHIEEARALKPGVMQLVDQILKVYVPAVLAFATAAVLFWTLGAWLIFGQPNPTRAVLAALAVLVMGYPCALGMATPLALIRGGGTAAEKGILIRSAAAFQAFKDLSKVVLDKTGTITKGKPAVVEVIPLGEHDQGEVLRLAASAESHSEHPLAQAIVERAQADGIDFTSVEDFQAVPGKGVRALLHGTTVLVGSLWFLAGEGVEGADHQEPAAAQEAQGCTVVGVAADGKLIGLVAIADTLKEDASEAIVHLKEAGLEPLMITGDNVRAAQAVADKVGIETVMAQVLPDQKAERVRLLQRQGHRVAMVGDGINDAPALMQADVGIAIGAGTDIAIESADVILVGERLGGVVEAYYIGKNSYRKTVQNLVLALAFNGLGIPLAATGLVHPVWAMVAMIASVSTVLLNSLGGKLIPKTRRREARMDNITLKVPTMHCQGCAEAVRKALLQLKGVQDVTVDLMAKQVAVTYERDGLKAERLREAIAQVGFLVG